MEKNNSHSAPVTYPLRTPRTRFNMKKDPSTIRGTKYTQLNDDPNASFVCGRDQRGIRGFTFHRYLRSLDRHLKRVHKFRNVE